MSDITPFTTGSEAHLVGMIGNNKSLKLDNEEIQHVENLNPSWSTNESKKKNPLHSLLFTHKWRNAKLVYESTLQK